MSAETQDRNNPNPLKRNRKKRKNFVANAKKYVKKGQMGRGTKIPEDLYQYFVGILDALKMGGIKDPEERQALVNNVLERTKGEELNVVGNQLGSRLVELLLPFSSPEDLERFIEILSPELRKLCSDNFTSHIVETLLRVACERATEYLQEDSTAEAEEVPKKKAKVEKEDRYPKEHLKHCHEFTLKICKYALNNLEDFVWDSYANHILRSALKCLSGITLLPGEKPKVNLLKEAVPDRKGIPPHQTTMTYKVVPDEFKAIVKEFANRLSMWPQFKDLPYQNITSALLQVLLYAVKNVDKNLTKDLVRKLLDESFVPEDWVAGGAEGKGDDKKDGEVMEEGNNVTADARSNLPPVFESESAVRLLEAALFVAKKKMYTQIYAKCFINRLGQLACLPMLNFTVQRLIDNCQIKEEFEPMFEELSSKFGSLLACGNTGVLVALAKACLRVRAKQMQFIQHLESALNCSEATNSQYFPVLCLRLQPLEAVDVTALDKEYFVNVHGSVILQCMLEFQRPAKVVNGLLDLEPPALVVILCDAKGCHVADAFCRSQCVGVKARDKLLWKLKGYYQKLALSQYGSRALDQIFEAAAPEQQVKMMSELADKSSLLNSTQYGRLVAAKLDLATFKSCQKTWQQNRLKIFEAAAPEQQVKMMSELADKSSLLNSTQYGRLVAAKLDLATFKSCQKTWQQNRLKAK